MFGPFKGFSDPWNQFSEFSSLFWITKSIFGPFAASSWALKSILCVFGCFSETEGRFWAPLNPRRDFWPFLSYLCPLTMFSSSFTVSWVVWIKIWCIFIVKLHFQLLGPSKVSSEPSKQFQAFFKPFWIETIILGYFMYSRASFKVKFRQIFNLVHDTNKQNHNLSLD